MQLKFEQAVTVADPCSFYDRAAGVIIGEAGTFMTAELVVVYKYKVLLAFGVIEDFAATSLEANKEA
jgi:hypothetical protein